MPLENTLIKMLNLYLEWMLSTGYSEVTVESRRREINKFLLWLEERSITGFQEVSKQIIERYRRYIYHWRKKDGKPLSIRTQSLCLVALRGFFKWLSKNNYILYNPASDLELPKVGYQLPRHVLTIDEVEAVINCVDLKSPLGLRDRAILEMFYSTGIRRRELSRLKLDDVELKRGILNIREGKWKKDRFVPIGERALLWIDKYIQELRPELVVEPDEGILFLNRKGEAIHYKYLTWLVSHYIEASGIGKKGSCHLFRHTMATLMLEGGADIRYVQEMLGHAKLETTQIYTRVAITKLKEIHARTHPGAQLERKNQHIKY